MPRVDQYISGAPISSDRGGQPSIRPLDATARATQQLGGAAQGLAGDIAAVSEKFTQINQQNENFNTEAAYQNFKAQEAVALDNAAREVQPGAAGFAETGRAGFAQRRDEFLQTQVPERLRERYAARFAEYGTRLSADYATVETRERLRFQTGELKKLGDTLAQEAFANPNDIDALVEEGKNAINESNLPAVQKQQAMEQWDVRARESAWRGLLERDPEAAVAALGVTIEEPPSTGIDSTVDRIIGVESRGNPNAKNKNSSAEGLGQFIDKTWVTMMTRYRPDVTAGKSEKEIIALKTNPALSREMTANYARENAKYLASQGIPSTDGNVYLAHFLGPQGAVNVLRANPETAISKVVNSASIKANPAVFGPNNTVGKLTKWANQKMAGSTAPVVSEPDQRFAGIPLERRLTLANVGRTELNKINTLNRSNLTRRADSQVSAVVANGVSTEPQLTLDDFKSAYNSGQAEEQYDNYLSRMEVASALNRIQRMSPEQQQTLLESHRPNETIDGANFAREQREFDALEQAIAQDRNAWAQDPIGQAHRANSGLDTLRENVQTAEAGAQQQAATQAYWEQLAADQRAKGIPPRNVRLVPEGTVESVVANIKNDDIPAAERIGAARDLIFSTGDPTQRSQVFQQLVGEGMPESYASVFRAWARGDRAAYNRLLEDAVIDAGKLPGSLEYTNAEINNAISDNLMDPNSVGGITYSVDLGLAENIIRAQRDTPLINNGVKRRVAAGMTPEAAAEEMARDLFGDMQAVTGSKVRATIPNDIERREFVGKADVALNVFNQVLRQTRDAGLNMLTDTVMSERERRTSTTVLRDKADRIIRDGTLRNIGGGYALQDPVSGDFVADSSGDPFVMTLDEIMTLTVGADGSIDLSGIRSDPTLGQVGINPPAGF